MTTILIAEDDDDVRELLQHLLTREGFTVQTAADGRAALELARRRPPNVVLTDLNMPFLDGLQLCEAIRRDPSLAGTPVAIVSGGLRAGDPRVAGTHVCDMLRKPFEGQDLVIAIRRLARAGRHTDHRSCSAST